VIQTDQLKRRHRVLPVLSVLLAWGIAAPVAQAQDQLEDQIARETAAEELRKKLVGTYGPGQAMVSAPVKSDNSISMCITTDATNRSGTYIGRTYWSVVLSKDGSEVVSARDVTGTFSRCYGATYDRFQELRQTR
jgi:hypothetical protein